MIFSERKKIVDTMLEGAEHCIPVETFRVTSIAEVNALYNRFLAELYEGGMLRIDAPYQPSINEYHSKYLLKIKPTFDTELEVSGYTAEGKGKSAGCLMIICRVYADNNGGMGELFTDIPVTPSLPIPDRIALATKMATIESNGQTHFDNQWKGRKIIIYYDELSKDNIPQRARTSLESRVD